MPPELANWTNPGGIVAYWRHLPPMTLGLLLADELKDRAFTETNRVRLGQLDCMQYILAHPGFNRSFGDAKHRRHFGLLQ